MILTFVRIAARADPFLVPSEVASMTARNGISVSILGSFLGATREGDLPQDRNALWGE